MGAHWASTRLGLELRFTPDSYGKACECPTAGIEDIVRLLQLIQGVDGTRGGVRFPEEMGMTAQHQARLHHIQDGANGRDPMVRLTTITQPGGAAVHKEHVNLAQGQTLFDVSTAKEGQAFERTCGGGIEVVVEVIKGPIEPGNTHLFSAVRERQDGASLQMMQMLQGRSPVSICRTTSGQSLLP